MNYSNLKAWTNKLLTQVSKKTKRKNEILAFLNDPIYFQKEIPFPNNSEEIIINKNFNLFKIIFIERFHELEIYKIFNKTARSDYGQSRNKIITFHLDEKYHNEGKVLKKKYHLSKLPY